MTTRKRNEFLDIPSDDDDEEGSEAGYDSEAAEDTKGRIQKRRRVASGEDGLRSDDEDKDEEEENDDDDEQQQHKQQHEGQQTQSTPTSTITTPAPNININTSKTATSKDEKKKTKTKQKAEKLEKSKNKTGVIYLSSLPPYLKPSALKSMLEARSFAPITKVFLTPATPPPGASGSGKRVTSNKRKTYTDGWVEFASKKTAKICAETLNASIVGGKKGGWYHDDVWNMKYLRGFKWGDLMEQVQRERSEREAKRRVEDSRARKEEKLFVSGVEKGKVLEGMQRKREEKDQRKKKIKGDGEGDDAAPKQEDDEAHGSAKAMDLQQGPKVPVRRLFKQNEVKTRSMAGDGDAENARLADDTKRVLGKIF